MPLEPPLPVRPLVVDLLRESGHAVSGSAPLHVEGPVTDVVVDELDGTLAVWGVEGETVRGIRLVTRDPQVVERYLVMTVAESWRRRHARRRLGDRRLRPARTHRVALQDDGTSAVLDDVGTVVAWRLTRADANNGMVDWSAAFKRTTEPQRRELSAEVRVNRNRFDFTTDYTDQPRNLDGTPATTEPARQLDALDESRTDLTLQADVIRPLGARGKFEFGYKGVLRELDNAFDASTYSYGAGAWQPDAARSNAFNYQDQVHAAYAVASRAVGPFNMQAGLRAEQARSQFDLATTGESFDNDYTSLYPSALVSWDMATGRQLKASYSKRVQRPHTTQMNPFVFREDALNVFTGNPYLNPEYTHSFELGYQHAFSKGSLQLTPFFRHTVDAVRAIRTVSDEGVNTVTFANLATADSYGADANGSFRIGNLNGFGGFNVFRSVSDASNLSTDVSTEAIGWSGRVNGSYKLTSSLDAQGFYMYRAPQDTEQGRITAMQMLTLSLRQKVYGDRASVTVRVQDPFNTMKFGSVQEDGRVVQSMLRHFGARGVFLNFSYNYGQAPRLRQRPVEQAPADPSAGATMGPTGG